MPTHTSLTELLRKLVFLAPAQTDVLETQINAAPEDALPALEIILNELLEEQDVMLRRIVDADPTFAEHFKKFVHDQFQKMSSQNSSTEQGALAALEQSLISNS